MKKEEYIKKFKVLDDILDDLWEKEEFYEHSRVMKEVSGLLDQMDADPDLTAEDRLYINSTMINYDRRKK